jgi:hypothetical protein
MAQQKRKILDQVLQLIDQLTTDELINLQRELDNKTWGQQFRELCKEIEADRISKGLPRLTDEEIAAEVRLVREGT